ncbi:MAG TPA: hypothetical protein PLG59_13575 [bacterium]|nr:hypothetical protein [bacterium]HQO35690.1 hypothetical protein [bacterium]HQP97941.1 hypothetical protein [bacterium]
MKLEKDELELLQEYESKSFARIQGFGAEKELLESTAKKSLLKDKRIDVRRQSHERPV